jgi:hypothetical protein
MTDLVHIGLYIMFFSLGMLTQTAISRFQAERAKRVKPRVKGFMVQGELRDLVEHLKEMLPTCGDPNCPNCGGKAVDADWPSIVERKHEK